MPKPKPSLDTFGQLIIDKRGKQGVRAAAAEIGVSSATLSRVENGNLPDLHNFKLICRWLEIQPNDVLGFKSQADSGPAMASVHFKKKKEISPATAGAIGQMIVNAHRSLLVEDDL